MALSAAGLDAEKLDAVPLLSVLPKFYYVRYGRVLKYAALVLRKRKYQIQNEKNINIIFIVSTAEL